MALTPPPRSDSTPRRRSTGRDADPDPDPSFLALLDEFTARWDRGSTPNLQDYLSKIPSGCSAQRVELIYRAFRLARDAGLAPSPDEFLARFSDDASELRTLFLLDDALTSADLALVTGVAMGEGAYPAGETIGPYTLVRELGRGGFAQVFLARQANLDHRLVVVKLSSRATPEPLLLARAGHPHIVEILAHESFDDGDGDGAVHVSSMPFLGGATLADVLVDRRRRGRAQPATGQEFLEELDRVSAPEHPGPGTSRPARQLIAGWSYPKTAAWVAARLAEALDFAFDRGVLHGDVKPSNVLMTAQGVPMLLDFNLAVGWRTGPDAGTGTGTGADVEPSADVGGTLAYMAPERIEGLALTEALARASIDPDGIDVRLTFSMDEDPGGSTDGGPRILVAAEDRALHFRVYDASGAKVVDTDSRRLREIARKVADLEKRLHGLWPPHELTREEKQAVVAAVKPIIEYTTTADRHRADVYSLGMVLLELLTGRAPDLSGLNGRRFSPRELASAYLVSRRQGGAVMIRASRASVAGGLRAILERCLAPDPAHRYRRAADLAEELDRWRNDLPPLRSRETSVASAFFRWARRRRTALAASAALVLFSASAAAAVWSAAERSRVGREQALDHFNQILDRPESGAFQLRRQFGRTTLTQRDPAVTARRHLEQYGVLSPGDWRQRDDVRSLPEFERDELEAFLLEQALRFAHALAGRPNARADYRRALDGLERASSGRFLAPIEAECQALRRKLGPEAPPAPDRRDPSPSGHWLETYLHGVEAELRLDDRGQPDWPDALEFYGQVLEERPGSFFANYRAAGAAFALAKYAFAADCLRACVRQRPEHAVLRQQLATCLYTLALYQDASDQFDRAEGLDPDYAETFLSRSYLRLTLGQHDQLQDDIARYEMLKGRVARPPLTPPLDFPPLDSGRDNPPLGASVPLDPDELMVHLDLGSRLAQEGRNRLAVEELDRVLASDPDNLMARYTRAMMYRELNRDANLVDREFARVVDHPRAEQLIRECPPAIYAFHRTVNSLIDQGQFDDALSTAQRALRLSERYLDTQTKKGRDLRARTHYSLALACVRATTETPARRLEALEHLRIARGLSLEYVTKTLELNPMLRKLAEELPPLPER